jgi:hypothetical protein
LTTKNKKTRTKAGRVTRAQVAPTPNVEIAMTGVDFNRNILTNKASLAGWLRNPAVLLVLLGALTFAVYGGTLVFQFVWDDNPQIVNNPIIRSWSAVPRVFASDLW